MPPAEDAALLLAIVQRHLKAWIVLADARPPRRHDLTELAAIAGLSLDPELLELQTFAVEARYEEGPFPLPAPREQLLRQIEALRQECQAAIKAAE